MKTITLAILLVFFAISVKSQNQSQRFYMAIDLGSAYTCVGIIDNGRVKTITNSFGNKFTPSVVSQMNEKIMIGEEAQNVFSINPLELMTNLKCLNTLKKNVEPFECIEAKQRQSISKFNSMGELKGLNPQKLTSLLLTRMKQIAQSHTGKKIDQVVITIPRSLADYRYKLIYSAAALSEFTDIYVETQPKVAYLPYDIFSKGSKSALVLELGQNYYGVNILNIENNQFQILDQYEDFFQDINDVQSNYVQQSKQMNTPYDQINKNIIYSLEAAFLAQKDINQVIIIGNSSKVPNIKEYMKQLFELKQLKQVDDIDLNEKTCYSTALLGKRIQKTWDFVNSVFSYSMSSISVGIQTVGGVFSRILMKNKILPLQMSKNYTTSLDNQQNLTIHIFEGQRLLTKHSHLIGTLFLQIPSLPKGVPQIEVTIKLDPHYVLTVTAIEKKLGIRKIIKFSQNEQISYRQIEQIQKQAIDNYLVDMIARREMLKDQFIEGSSRSSQSVLVSLHEQFIQECNFQHDIYNIEEQMKNICPPSEKSDQVSSQL